MPKRKERHKNRRQQAAQSKELKARGLTHQQVADLLGIKVGALREAEIAVRCCSKGDDDAFDELPPSTRSCLAVDGIFTLTDLAQATSKRLLRIPSFGRGCLGEVNELLAGRGLALADAEQPQQT